MDGLTATYVILTLVIVIITFRSFHVTRELSNAALEESRRQSEAALQVARESTAATLKTIEEMKETRDQESAPYVVAYFDLNFPLIFFVVKNLGKSVATEIKLSIDPPMAITQPILDLNKLSFLKDGIAALAPGSEIRTIFASSTTYFDDPPARPRKYKATIVYKGGLSLQPRWHEMTLNLSAYEGTIHHNKNDLNDLVKEVEQIRRTFGELNSTSKKIAVAMKGGFWIKNAEILSINLNLENTTCLSFIGTKLQEFKTKWQAVYGKTLDGTYNEEEKELVDPDDSNTLNDCMLLGQQILFAFSKCQATLPEDLADKITHVATSLLAMGKMEAIYFGEDRTKEFNEAGENTLREIEDISKLIEGQIAQLTQSNQKQY